jgi:hypothetical protein
MFPVRLRERLMDLAYPAWFMWCASSLLDGIVLASLRRPLANSDRAKPNACQSRNHVSP